ncbi:hypothetical protein EDB95_1536 [Dinghuibacter silviterrae]|uniref:Uncharacterized protein n=1 Tax=Dinghuibacter silviterrae TaxID=1539049 RepID=A0A4R8DTQ1_9BACT|nr:hypothetical protein EDB95_1536 [Dinghuibacter silviterrae]
MVKQAKRGVFPTKEAIAGVIAGRIVVAQRYIANRLGKWESKCSVVQKKLVLLLFCLVFGSYCSYLLVDALWRPQKVTQPLRDIVRARPQEPPLQFGDTNYLFVQKNR